MADERGFDVVGSPWWWLRKLEERLDARAERIAVYQSYYDGDHPLPFASQKFREAFGGMFQQFSVNWMEPVISTVEDRLNVEGFRVPLEGDPEGEDPGAGDQEAWAIWQRNFLDADSSQAHLEALINGASYALVWVGADNLATVTIEHPSQMIVAHAPGVPRIRLAALKRFVDDYGTDEYATVYLPDGIYKFVARRSEGTQRSYQRWQKREVENETWPVPNPVAIVPVVPLVNRPRLLHCDGESEIHRVIPVQDTINKLVADLLVASEFAAFPQRYATGMEPDEDPQTGEKRPPFKIAIDRLLLAENPETRFGVLQAADLSNYVTPIEMEVKTLASQSRTPLHYLVPLQGQMPSGETLRSAEAPLVKKVRRKMKTFGEGWEEVIRLSFLFQKDQRGAALSMETIWGDPETRTESEHVDALVKLKTLGVPDAILQEKAGFTPQEIERIKALPDVVVEVSPNGAAQPQPA